VVKGSLAQTDLEDLAQERALALLEGRDPTGAEHAYRNREARWRETITFLDDGAGWVTTHLASVPLPIRPSAGRKPVHYSPEVLARKRAYSREWWKRKGPAYRRERKKRSPGGAL
jgi:hypothetical protein